ncbi:MAG: 2-hydroxychromene-2-carboxylate isomerase [Pseudomonadales bacterium]
MANVEFHFDFGSPNAYLAHLVIPQIEARTGVKFNYVPVLLGGVFKATNNVSPAVSLQGIKNKPEYTRIETQRFLAAYGVEGYTLNPHFPVNTLRIMRGAVFAQTTDYFEKYVDAMYQCMWREAKKMDEPEIVAESLSAAGLPAAEILAGMEDPAIKQQLIANTEASVSRGTFGSPTFFVDDDIYFGKNTLRDVEESIAD